ncbi:hypothetical protein [Burkholderia pyrrocinia]|uniref:hypothetical protein n=1 Tax=Burkholderia pyrrocinia TaxID=60550 RepID=UPI00201B75CA|nr:hypothetical protein [Burkholderia pyrrocinia]
MATGRNRPVRHRCPDRRQSAACTAPTGARQPDRESSMTGISIRSANIDDAQAIADFHVKVWRHTYRDLAPAQAHAVLDEHYRGRKWQEKLASNDGDQLVLVAPSEPIFDGRGEIKFLYVDPEFKHRCIGRTLRAQLAAHLMRCITRGTLAATT